MARGIRELKKQYEGRQFEYEMLSKKVTTTYYSTLVEYSQKEVAKQFDITVSAVRNLLDYAIVNCIVTEEEAVLVRNKAIQNQQRKHSEAGGSSVSHHVELMKKREDYIASGYEEIAILEVISEVTYSKEKFQFQNVVEKFNLRSKRLLWLIIKRAIVENICSDKELDIITEKCYKLGLSTKKVSEFRELIEKRTINRIQDKK